VIEAPGPISEDAQARMRQLLRDAIALEAPLVPTGALCPLEALPPLPPPPEPFDDVSDEEGEVKLADDYFDTDDFEMDMDTLPLAVRLKSHRLESKR